MDRKERKRLHDLVCNLKMMVVMIDKRTVQKRGSDGRVVLERMSNQRIPDVTCNTHTHTRLAAYLYQIFILDLSYRRHVYIYRV